MSYQVLARKWRPQNFHQLVGQSHVKQALINGLEQKRLHHAYLFTGTRGVGKTTIARIFSKSLNCEQGITAEPCGVCSTCLDIEEGRYIDLLEIDAASRTKVEDTREILDNVQYAPSRGRYKVYLIDEVHMLSKHSFNALLKTLEEPPEHVKFLLATTDPQKLPVTILSRCLQFNLSALTLNEIQKQLETILNKERLTFELEALKLLAKAADGSMRDALSLTDQAIAQTNGLLETQPIMQMLGLIDISWSQKLFVAILCQDGETLLEVVSQLALHNPNYKSVLDDLLALTHLVLMTQLVPSAAKLDENNEIFISEVAEQSNAEQIQIYYQLLLNGKKDLLWAPEAKLGFEMVLLRLLAFEPLSITRQNVNIERTSQKPGNKMASLRQLLNTPKVEKKSDLVVEPDINTLKSSPDVVNKNHDNLATKLTNTRIQNDVGNNSLNAEELQNSSEAEVNTQMLDVLNEAQTLLQPQSLNVEENMNGAQFNASLEEEYTSVEKSRINLESHKTSANIPMQDNVLAIENVPSITEKTEKKEVNSELPNVTRMMSGAQSAIARILANRNVSGTGKLSTPSKNSQNETSHLDDTLQKHDQKKRESQKGSQVSNVIKSEDTPKKPPIKTKTLERIKSDPSNLAPELLIQIAGDKNKSEDVFVQEVEVPDGFESPLSNVKFAYQQDHWADVINNMQLGGRIRQFALHATYQKQDNLVSLNVDMSQQHLDSQNMRDQLQMSLSKILNEEINLQVQFEGQVENSPYLIQQNIDVNRLQHAIEVLKQDPVVSQFLTRFNAQMDETSVRTR
ncbi:DNA polymerase III subunit gamma/tau [Pseudoalteromonas denitrificans]|uniref:DNA polymerase III subunit gamma/tau n=1 Tax=Pseudoalteromonas denitrificans DSM 6059 TaxID=1123010 RepID=A0A1I1EYR7_9GAMM|nr:DNA polymerase III subunit gamma/tau [Pseudoalteromonas denitrificans]SFB91812.1 DNA polymerase III, gamma subunit /DNA polymerase III, tau subunit [Pseudoalteromonas denitrificans DSM 6059]